LKEYIQLVKNWFPKSIIKQKKVFTVSGIAVFAAVLAIFVLSSMGSSDGTRHFPESESVTIYSPIPAQELFLPDEPDFIPGVLLQREQRTHWSEQDAAEYWQDPLRFGEEAWRERIEAAIDELLERVP